MKINLILTCAALTLSACAAENKRFADWKSHLPRPIYDERPELVDFYYKAWEIAHTRIDEVPGIPAPRYMDEAHRSDRIWIWDRFGDVVCSVITTAEQIVVTSNRPFKLIADGQNWTVAKGKNVFMRRGKRDEG